MNWIVAGVPYPLEYFSPVGGWQLNCDTVRLVSLRILVARFLFSRDHFLRDTASYAFQRVLVFLYRMKPFQDDSTCCLLTPASHPVAQ